MNTQKTAPNLDGPSLKELKAELVENGMPAEDAELYVTKAQARAVLNTLKAKEVIKKVDTLEDKESPQEKKVFERQYMSKKETMRLKLMAQPKVMFLIPLDKNEKPGDVVWETDRHGNETQIHKSGAVETVQLNGFKWIIPKGVMTEIPQQVAEELSKSMNITMQAGRQYSLDRVDSQTGKPVSAVLQ
jgi:hypothetical protein